MNIGKNLFNYLFTKVHLLHSKQNRNDNFPPTNQVHEKLNSLDMTDLKNASDGFDNEYEGVADETEDDGQHLGEQHGATLGQLHLHPVLQQVSGK